MTKNEFRELTKQYVYLDGATGSNLVMAGMPSGVCPENWILENRDIMLQLQKNYVSAGSDILYTPTFTANRIKLSEYHLQDQMSSMIKELVGISREAASCAMGRKVYIAGDITMTGELLKPIGNMELEELIAIYKEQILELINAGVDLLVVETMMSLAETRAALIAAKEVCDLPVMVSMSFEEDGKTLYGTDAKTAAIVLEALGAAAIGVNCSTGPDKMKQIVADMISVTDNIPILAKPNAGLPYIDENGNSAYFMDAQSFVNEMKTLVEAGATIIGGCCGTSPEYIRLLRKTFGRPILKKWNGREAGTRFLTSERMTVAFGLDENLILVGERINPTGKKALQAQLKSGCMDMVLQFAEEQEACGARILDINLGMSGINEKELMLKTIEEVSVESNLPLSLDSSHVDVLEAALRHYPGRALVNSVSLEKEKIEKLLPIVKKYGAMFILLPLSDQGLPKTNEEKKAIIETIVNRALELGMTREDIVVDGLVTTVGANRKAAIETLETISYCKRNGLATICGLSNISFGMPERSYVNTAFLTLAIKEGLTMAIANPSQELLVGCAMATDLLLDKEEADGKYIDYVGRRPPKKETALTEKSPVTETQIKKDRVKSVNDRLTETPGNNPENGHYSALYRAVLKGNRNEIGSLTKKALKDGEEPDSLLNEALLPAINEVGELFDKGKYFLPQLIGSAEAMKSAIEVLEPFLSKKNASDDMPVVIIATVEGDIHDIGKNLVALMLRNYGFKVIDLGKDVPKERIIEAANEYHARIIALSALMTTTMQRMKEVVMMVKEQKLNVKVMIGGAVITQDYADEIGADGYSRDAADAVRVAKQLI